MIATLALQGANAVGMVAAYSAGKKHRWCWLLAILSEVFWLAWCLTAPSYGVIPYVVIWSAFYARNWWKWGKS